MTEGHNKYQVMPEHSEEEYEALKADIALYGVQQPIVVDESGNVLDGHTRLRIVAELEEEGVSLPPYPRTVVRNLESEAAKRTEARRRNTMRRQLKQKQKIELAKDQLKDTPEWANARIGHVVGLHRNTIGKIREALEATGEIPYHDTLVDERGQRSPSRKERRENLMGVAKANHEAKEQKKGIGKEAEGGDVGRQHRSQEEEEREASSSEDKTVEADTLSEGASSNDEAIPADVADAYYPQAPSSPVPPARKPHRRSLEEVAMEALSGSIPNLMTQVGHAPPEEFAGVFLSKGGRTEEVDILADWFNKLSRELEKPHAGAPPHG